MADHSTNLPEVAVKICSLLEPLSSNERRRVWQSSLLLLDETTTTSTDESEDSQLNATGTTSIIQEG